MANLSEIAEQVGISKTAVSLYLNDPTTTRLSKEKKGRIDEVIKALSYRPNVIARSLSQNRTRTISIIIPYNGTLFRSSFVNEVLSGIQSELFRNGYSMIFLPTRGEDSPIMVKNHLKISRGYDGLIIFGTRYCTMEALENNVDQLLEAGSPFVTVNMPELHHSVNQVILRTPRQSNPIQYFINTGHKRILLVIGREHDPESIETLQLCRSTLERNDIQPQPELVVYGDYERDIARSEVLKSVKLGSSFTAVYALSDTMAIGVYEALKELDCSIPGDVSVIGTNDSFFSCNMAPPLTTIRKQVFACGEEAAKLLLRTINTGKTGRKVWLDSELVLRSSTRVCIEEVKAAEPATNM